MSINLTELFSQTINDVKVSRDLDLKTFEFGELNFLISEPIHIDLDLTKLGAGDYLAQGKISATFVMNCDRCMKDVPTTVEADFAKELKELTKDSKDEDEDLHEYLLGSILNLEKLVLDEVYMNVPMKVLCRDNCEGICKQCGTNLNDANCNCEDDNVDPRLAGLKDLFNERF